ncbi:MAG TPA: MFS transporter [Jatrophihabitans sp.]|nr:MFS transporter [Jatrophihabitans sp.]
MPARLGRPFWLVWSASTVSSLGDGVRYVAFPLLAASLSHDPRAVAVVAVAGYLPWPLFGLVGGAVVDRTDRRRLMWRTDVLRAALVTGCALAVATARAPIALLAVVAFLLGLAETFFDNAASAIVPMLVEQPAIERANSWLFSSQTVMSTLLGAPLGGALFAVAKAVPLAADAVSFALASALVALVVGSFHPRADSVGPITVRQDIAEGLRWLLTHRLLRILALLLAVINATFAAAEAVLVLYSLEVLRLPASGYGVLLALVAVGGLLGTLVAGGLRRLLGLRWVLAGVGLVQAGMLLVAGLTSSRLLMVVGLLLVGAVSMVWNVVTVSLRQRLVPAELLGRVTSSYRVIGLGAMPVGAALGGVLAKGYGLHMPYLVSGLVLAAATIGCLPLLGEPERVSFPG